jgi:hypothetical protein
MVYLEPRQHKALKARARAEGISLAELIRRLVSEHLTEERSPASGAPEAYERLVALGSSGRDDISDEHDAHLGAALQREHAR